MYWIRIGYARICLLFQNDVVAVAAAVAVVVFFLCLFVVALCQFGMA